MFSPVFFYKLRKFRCGRYLDENVSAHDSRRLGTILQNLFFPMAGIEYLRSRHITRLLRSLAVVL